MGIDRKQCGGGGSVIKHESAFCYVLHYPVRMRKGYKCKVIDRVCLLLLPPKNTRS